MTLPKCQCTAEQFHIFLYLQFLMCNGAELAYKLRFCTLIFAVLFRDLRIVFFCVRIESRIESAVYTTQAVTQPDRLHGVPHRPI